MKQAGAAVLIVVAALFLLGQAAPRRTVEGEKFVLKDAEGKEAWSLEAFGTTLAISDSRGRFRATVEASGDSTGFVLHKPDGGRGFSVSTERDEGWLFLYGSGRRGWVDLHASSDALSLSLVGNEGEGIFLNSTEEGPSLVLSDKEKVLWKAP